MYKDFTGLCQALRDAETAGYTQGVELATINPPKIGQEKGKWKESLHDYSLHTDVSAESCGSFSSPEINAMVWLIYESAKEDGINFVVRRAGYFPESRTASQISEF